MATIVVHGSKVNLREAGAGEYVILLHSTSSSGAQWRALMDRLSPRFRVVAPDLHGYGRSDHWPRERLDLIQDEVAIVEAILDGTGAPAHLVGHSYGGHVAARAALRNQSRLLSLTLIEPAMHYLLAQGGETSAYSEIRSVADKVLAAIDRGEPARAASTFLDYWVSLGAFAEMSVEHQASVVESMKKLQYEWPYSLSQTKASLQELRDLATPTLLIVGERTTMALTRLTHLLYQALPSRSLVSIPGAGHMSPVTHPDQVNLAIEEHIYRFASPFR